MTTRRSRQLTAFVAFSAMAVMLIPATADSAPATPPAGIGPASATPNPAATPPAGVGPAATAGTPPPVAETNPAAPVNVPTLTDNGLPPLPAPAVINGEPAGPAMTLSIDQVIAKVLAANPTVQLAQERIDTANDAIGTITAQGKPQVHVGAADTLTSYKAFAPSEIGVTPVDVQGVTIPTITDTAQSGLFTGSSSIGSSSGLTAGQQAAGTGSTTTTTTSTLTIVPVSPVPGTSSSTTTAPSAGSSSGGGSTSGNAPVGGGTAGSQVRSNGQDQQTAVDHQTSGSGGGSTTIPGGQYNNYGASITATQLIDVFGLVGQTAKVANENVEFYRIDLDRTLNELALTTKNVFYAVLLAQANVATSQEQVNNAQATVKDTEIRFTAGAVAHYDVISAESQLQNAQQALIAAQNDLIVQRETLNNLLHQPLDTGLVLTAPALPVLPGSYDASTEVKRAYTTRPEMRQANLTIDMATRLVKLQQAGLKPTIDLGFTGNYVGGSSTSSAFGGESGPSASLTAEVDLPLLDGGLTKARVAGARDALKSQNIDIDQLQQNIDLEVRSALAVLVDAATLVNADVEGVTLSQEALRLARVRYDAGAGTLLEVTNAEATLATSEYNLSNAQFQLQNSFASLQRAEGGR